jgi:tetratricopeptide (TPR) repeat protein
LQSYKKHPLIGSKNPTTFVPMKLRNLLLFALSLVALASCTNKAKSYKKAYEMNLAAGDYRSAIVTLEMWMAEDSTIQSWAFDSLAHFHYFYTAAADQQVRNPKTPMYFVDRGLQLKSKNTFLREIKAKLLLEEGKDTASIVIFKELWDETKDQTFWWDMCFVEMARGDMMGCDSMVSKALADPKINDKKVRMEHIAAGIKEEVNAKAAYIYLQALMLRSTGNIMACANALQAALEIEKDFYAAKQSIVDLQRAYAQQQGQKK